MSISLFFPPLTAPSIAMQPLNGQIQILAKTYENDVNFSEKTHGVKGLLKTKGRSLLYSHIKIRPIHEQCFRNSNFQLHYYFHTKNCQKFPGLNYGKTLRKPLVSGRFSQSPHPNQVHNLRCPSDSQWTLREWTLRASFD